MCYLKYSLITIKVQFKNGYKKTERIRIIWKNLEGETFIQFGGNFSYVFKSNFCHYF